VDLPYTKRHHNQRSEQHMDIDERNQQTEAHKIYRADDTDGTFWLGDDGIVRAISPPGAEDTLANAKASLREIKHACGGTPRPVLVDIRWIKSATLEARRFWSSDALIGVVTAAALLVASPVSRVMGNFYIGLRHMHVPTRMFNDEDTALEWLKEYLEPHKTE
jgi:hypothetical protein